MPEAAAGEPDLAEHRGERHRHPGRLLAMLDTLQRIVDVYKGARRRHAPGEGTQALRLDPADGFRPLGCFWSTVIDAKQVALETWIARAKGVEERAVVKTFLDEHVGEPEHQGDIGARCDREPLGVDEVREVIA